jgi:hypothetical protein
MRQPEKEDATMTDAPVEKIHGNAETGDDWECLCGNNSGADGFYPVGPDGQWIEPNLGSAWDNVSYGCAGCGRIINQNTFEVTGHMTQEAMAADQPG